MKKIFLNLAAFANIKVDKAAIEAQDQLIVSEDDFAKINTALEEAKGFKSQFETINAELTALKLANAETATATATATETAQATIAELTSEVTRLGALSGGEETKIKKEELDAKTLGLPSHCNASLEIYQFLEATS